MTKFFVDFAMLGAEWVLWLLVALSILSIGVMIDRALWFRARDTDTETFTRELRGAFERDELEHVKKKYAQSAAIPILVALRGLDEVGRGTAAIAEAMHAERAKWKKEAERNLIVLGTLGNNVPFVGLFGTVLGVIKELNDLTGAAADASGVMKGLSQALVATAVGLLVAIPAVVAYNFFQRRLKVILGGADETAHAVLSFAHAREHKGA
ncbi:MAG TPA: MotA/TolQ/ExbB proton channel family protein [Kofleriaceae bacterium]|nr:MotA/TolQ/ExbB proton channel family protein [Kofleriaceae bacterium]